MQVLLLNNSEKSEKWKKVLLEKKMTGKYATHVQIYER